jgi:hypothetical protein
MGGGGRGCRFLQVSAVSEIVLINLVSSAHLAWKVRSEIDHFRRRLNGLRLKNSHDRWKLDVTGRLVLSES